MGKLSLGDGNGLTCNIGIIVKTWWDGEVGSQKDKKRKPKNVVGKWGEGTK